MQLVVLDRDGVINEERDAHVRAVSQWYPIPGSLEAVARLYQAGYRVVVATNQSGLARGLFDIDALNAIHETMHGMLSGMGGRIDVVLFCPHDDGDRCACRKPRPGLLNDLSERLQVSLAGVPMIGDSERDLAAARAAGGRPMLVRTGNGRDTESRIKGDPGVAVFDDLATAVDALLDA